MKRFLFFYTELAEYIVACMRALSEANAEVHVVRWPVNSEAPFNFELSERLTFYERRDFDEAGLIALAEKIHPHAILTSGWVDKGYLAVSKAMKSHCNTVLLLDNQYKGTIKQRIQALRSPFYLKRIFSHAWVPGEPQALYAKKLGFSDDHVFTGIYCANTSVFKAFYASRSEQAPKKFIFIGRYLPFKGIVELWSAFTRFQQEFPEWELNCLGTGDMWDQRVQSAGINHAGFVQPKDLPHWLNQSGVFVLPSHREPWGVVVHELAEAGFPMICSDAVGAATMFLKENQNGYLFQGGNEQSLYEAMRKMALLSADERRKMGEKSHELAEKLTTADWVKTALTLARD
jgi:glycosyltransferase involved in cell wall biosynthesis